MSRNPLSYSYYYTPIHLGERHNLLSRDHTPPPLISAELAYRAHISHYATRAHTISLLYHVFATTLLVHIQSLY
jgi:hypothetical protein